MEFNGKSLIGYAEANGSGTKFTALEPATGQVLPGEFQKASSQDVEDAVKLAESASVALGNLGGKERGALFRAIAASIEGAGEAVIERAHRETALTVDRLRGELARTTNQLWLFASVCEEGSWVDARIDTALPDRKPLPRPDLRSMLRPLGPVVVFGASNFPLAFSVAGGDTASALAAGNPVIVKAHPAHPGTSELVGRAVIAALEKVGAPEGTFSLLFDDAIEVGQALVKHAGVKAVGFTGSHRGGRALMDLAASRPQPIPVFAEMSSTNPMFVLPEALRARSGEIAAGLVASFTLGVGQFCTKPGLVFVEAGAHGDSFVEKVVEAATKVSRGTLLTAGIAATYRSGVKGRSGAIRLLAGGGASQDCGAEPAVFETNLASLTQDLVEELFGPSVVIVRCNGAGEMLDFVSRMPGQLTATVHGTESDLIGSSELVRALQQRVGRVIFNGFPTGVEVSHAMVHGGTYPAVSDSRFTSVGTSAIRRFARPVCFQSFPDAALPIELQNANPRKILRLVNGTYTRDAMQ
ncbi:MAG TPA: aldehyde dehydrogenase (NADP(+)) [Terriglobales bacterium]